MTTPTNPRDELKAQEHAPDCADPAAEPELSFGLAGGGYGAYGYCPYCGAIQWKIQEGHGDD